MLPCGPLCSHRDIQCNSSCPDRGRWPLSLIRWKSKGQDHVCRMSPAVTGGTTDGDRSSWGNMPDSPPLALQFTSVQFSHSVVSDSLWPHESQHARPPCPSPTPRVHSDSCPLSRWCHPAISSSIVPFSSCPQSLPASESFPMSQLFAWGGQSIGVSALTSVLPMNTQDWSPLEWTGWISMQSKGLSRVFSNTIVQKHQSCLLSFFMVHRSHSYMTIGESIALATWTFVGKVMSLLFNMLVGCP